MAITNISLLGLGAEGAVAYYALRQTLPSNQIAVLASGERASRLKAVLSENIYLDIWRKYMLNAACNTVETIFKGTHRWFQNISEACDAMEWNVLWKKLFRWQMQWMCRCPNRTSAALTDSLPIMIRTECAAWYRI